MFDLVNQYQTSVREFMATCDAFSFLHFRAFGLKFSEDGVLTFVGGRWKVFLGRGREGSRQEGTNMQSDSFR